MRTRTVLAWIAVGLIGLALAAGVTYAATQLSSQRIGLSAEPPSAGEELAPPTPRHAPRTSAATTSTQSSSTGPGAPSTVPTEERGYREHRDRHGEGFDDRDD